MKPEEKAMNRIKDARRELKLAISDAMDYGCATCQHRNSPIESDPCCKCSFNTNWSFGK